MTNSGHRIEIPDLPEYSKGELTRMEREVTGLYLSGHPMDDYRELAKNCAAVSIGEILSDCMRIENENANEAGTRRFKDNQKITIAGVVEAVRTKPTRNNTLMAYITLDDGTGTIELLAFQRAIDEAGAYMQPDELVLAVGKLSERDEKEPQVVVDSLVPLKDAQINTNFGNKREKTTGDCGAEAAMTKKSSTQKTLYVQLESENTPEYEHLKRVHMMFPGRENMVVYFKDTKKKAGATCIIHEAFVAELIEKFGKENVVVQ